MKISDINFLSDLLMLQNDYLKDDDSFFGNDYLTRANQAKTLNDFYLYVKSRYESQNKET